MNSLFSALILANILIVPAVVHATESGRALAAKYHCLACHAPGRKVLGPSFKEIATKYANDKSAQERLARKIGRGSSGVWGAVPGACGKGAGIPDADKITLINYIRSIK